MSKDLPQKKRDLLKSAARQFGFSEAEVLFELAIGSNQLTADQIADLFEQFPQNPALPALAIHRRVGIHHFDPDQWLTAFEMFETDYPQLAFCCAMVAASFEDERGDAALTRGLKIAEALEAATSAIHNRLTRARKALHECIQHKLGSTG